MHLVNIINAEKEVTNLLRVYNGFGTITIRTLYQNAYKL